MRRREFIAGVGGAAVWPIAARAQQGDRLRRIGVLMSLGEADPEAKASLSAFTQRLAELGWTDGRNLRIDVRWGSDTDGIGADAVELVSTNPEVLLADSTPTIQELQRLTQAIPIVFVNIGDPVETGVVARLTRPGGNTTGFLNMEPSIGGKWLQVLKETAPSLKRVLVNYGVWKCCTRCPLARNRGFGVCPLACNRGFGVDVRVGCISILRLGRGARVLRAG